MPSPFAVPSPYTVGLDMNKTPTGALKAQSWVQSRVWDLPPGQLATFDVPTYNDGADSPNTPTYIIRFDYQANSVVFVSTNGAPILPPAGGGPGLPTNFEINPTILQVNAGIQLQIIIPPSENQAWVSLYCYTQSSTGRV